MSERTVYSEELKATVMSALLTGQSAAFLAREYKIPQGTIESWSSRLKNNKPATLASEKRAKIGELLIEYLDAGLTALRKQADFVGNNEAWLEKQEASQLAVLHGVLADKQIRIIELLAPNDQTDDQGEEWEDT